MPKEIMGVSMERLESPIRIALTTYQEISNGLKLDADVACNLNLTPDKPNSARSEVDASFRGTQIGKMYIIAFKPGDGTGSEVSYQLKDLLVDSPYPKKICIVPRNKTGVHSEAHLTVVTHKIDDPHAEPELFAGLFDLLGLKGNTVKKIAELGRPTTQETATPMATLTVGYGKRGERFGDPHAIYNAIQTIQVCAFLAIAIDIHKVYPDILAGLNPQQPAKLE